ncbi:MAG: hypothetical protein KatS3mg010_0634 [Acidimicrobiia bacterium]|nr:MAG: hypothetical protein KatS3mg010_0634 [Acidimicrobiia bacterium]
MKTVLPRRHRPQVDAALAPLLDAFRSRHPKADASLVEHAYEVARDAHRDQVRRSGDPYIAHPLGVAMILADLGLDDVTLAAALLHDAVEDTSRHPRGPHARVRRRGRGDRRRRHQARPAAVRLEGGAAGRDDAQDARGDGEGRPGAAHQARRPAAQHADDRVAAGGEAGAHRAARRSTSTRRWRTGSACRTSSGSSRTSRSRRCTRSATPRSSSHGVAAPPRSATRPPCGSSTPSRRGCRSCSIAAEVTGRPKHLWSIYEKMVVKGKEFDEINDLVGVRVIVDSVKDCYARARLDPRALATGTGPVQGLRGDAQVQPVPVAAHHGRRTAGQARRGPDPHARDAPPGRVRRRRALALQGAGSPAEDLAWLSRLVDWQQETDDPAEFMASLKIDLEQDEVFVFTPKGDGRHPAGGRHAGRLRLRDPHRGRPPLHRRAGQRPARPARLQAALGRHRARSSPQGRGSRPAAGLAAVRADPEGAQRRSGSGSRRERRGDAIDAGRDELSKALRREGLPVQQLGRHRVLTRLPKAQLRRPRRALTRRSARGTCRRRRVVQRVSAGAARGERGGGPGPPSAAPRARSAATRRPACTSRGSTT